MKMFKTLQFSVVLCISAVAAKASDEVSMNTVYEVSFQGPTFKTQDTPVADIELVTTWQHESGNPVYQIYGFYDGDGKGGMAGDIFKVRFCPTRTGNWKLIKTSSTDARLNGQQEGMTIRCTDAGHQGFWEVDTASAGQRWFKRSDGSHSYIMGNTMYSFLSEYFKGEPTGGNIIDDVRNNAQYFNKIRFAITGDRYPHPTEKPFLDDQGKPTDDGNFSHRPNPAWFHHRVDLAVQTAFEQNIIADIILNGPDAQKARSALKATENGGDATPFLRYMAARYGSYPHVWLCLSNEYDIKKPVYSEKEMVAFGERIKSFLPYPTPVSVHASPRSWDEELNTDKAWNNHIIVQNKLKKLDKAADFIVENYSIGAQKPVINDELAYEGAGDGWLEADVIEAFLGVFLGGGYGSTGYKPANKEGHYFAGHFKAEEHTSADNLLWFRQMIDQHIRFWQMQPVQKREDNILSIFSNTSTSFRAMEWKNHAYVLGTNQEKENIKARLPEGKWQVIQFDLMKKKEKLLEKQVSGVFQFDAPASRAVLFYFKKL